MGSVKTSSTDDENEISPRVLIGFWIVAILFCLVTWVGLAKIGKKVLNAALY